MQRDRARPKAPTQQETVEQSRRDSCLDRRVPLAYPSLGHPEGGTMTIARYYSIKHGPNGSGRGRFWPLHETQTAWGRKAS